NWDFRTTGSVWSCSNPADIQIVGQGGTIMFNIETWTFSGKYNTGGTSPGTATDLAKDVASGRVCDQVCGDVKQVCGDNSEYYRVVLPAHKAAVVQATFATRTGTTAFDLNVLDMAGGQICPLISNSSTSTVPNAYKARLVNNTNVDQPVLIAPLARNVNNLT